MRRGTRTRSAGTILLSVLVAALMAAPVPVAGHGPFLSAAAPEQHSTDFAGALGVDGAFRGAPGLAGTVDTSAWTLVSNLAAGEPPRFAPAGVAIATPIGPWSALGSNGGGDGALIGGVFALAVSGSDLYVGGQFTNAAGIATADFLAKWNGSVWSALGSNGAGDGALIGNVDALAVSGSDLYVGGSFDDAAGIATADHLAKWNGSAWSALGSNGFGNGAIQGVVDVLAASGSDLYVGGSFDNAASIPEADHIAKWNGSTWSALGSDGAGDGALNNFVYALAVSGGDLYVGGVFVDAAGIATADFLAKWNGSVWSALGSNGAGDGALNNGVDALAVSGTDLYVGGFFLNAAGIATADFLVKWNGSTWSALGSDGAGDGALNFQVLALAVSGGDLYVGGDFDNVAGVATADYIAKWNGSAWSALGSNGSGEGPLNNPPRALAVSGTDLYAGGDFFDAAGIPEADNVARWALVARFVAADFNGDGTTDIAVYRPSEGRWYISGQGNTQFGTSTDIPVPADYNGDGTTDIAVYRPSEGRWYIKDQGNTQFGTSTDIPVPADYNGDGSTDIAVYRPSEGRWYISGVGNTQFGTSTDIPVPGDYNGDGTTDIAVYRPSEGRWYISGVGNTQFGTSTDIPVPGDYNGDGTTDIAIYRPSEGRWYISGQGNTQFGTSTDRPEPGDYNGNGTTDIAVYRPSEGRWYINGVGNTQFGTSTDIPVVLPVAVRLHFFP